MARTGFLLFGVDISVDTKDGRRSVQTRSDRHEAMTQQLRALWSEPTDTFITDDIPLLLTKLSSIPAVPGRKG